MSERKRGKVVVEEEEEEPRRQSKRGRTVEYEQNQVEETPTRETRGGGGGGRSKGKEKEVNEGRGGDSRKGRKENNKASSGEEEEAEVEEDSQLTPNSLNVYSNLDPKTRRETRAAYRRLEADLDRNKEKYTDPLSEDLHRKLDEGNALYRTVNTTLEALRDSRFLATTANYAAIQAQRLKSTFVTFDGNVMMNKVVSILGGRDVGQEEDYNLDFNWENLSKIIMKNSKRVPNVDFLLGPLEIEHRVVKRAPIAKEKREVKELKQTKRLTEADIQKNENETPKNVMAINRCLEEQGKINYFQFVINPFSFSQTVENIFYLSFLIRDGKAKIEISHDDGQPYVSTSTPSTEEQQQQRGVVRKQIIVEITMEQWQTLIDLFNIKDTIIPTRPKKT